MNDDQRRQFDLDQFNPAKPYAYGTLNWNKNLSNLHDISPTYPTNGQFLVWNTTNKQYIPSTSAAGVVPITRLINTTAPLTGGGDLSADRTISIDTSSANDFDVMYFNAIADAVQFGASSDANNISTWVRRPDNGGGDAFTWIDENVTTIPTTGGTTSLNGITGSTQIQFTGTTTHNLKLPNATFCGQGRKYRIMNDSTGTITVKDNGSNVLGTVLAGNDLFFTLIDASFANGTWRADNNTYGVGPVGAAGGDLTGTYPNPTIKASVNLSSNPTTTTQATTDNSTRIATTAYVTTGIANAIAGVNPAVAVAFATTAASDTSSYTYNNGVSGIGATLTGAVNVAFTADGQTATALLQRVLIKNDTQAPSGAFNGVYYVSQLQTAILPPILTRALDYDMPSDINSTGAIPVVSGTVNALTSWLLTSQITTVGTDPLTYVQFSINPTTQVTTSRNINTTSPITGGGNLSADRTIAINATSANTASYVVQRDSSGNFSAGTITASLSGNASTVTTNANLTGPITSSGNATAIASQTGTGTKFVVDTSPTLVTPLLGTPTSGVLTNCTALPVGTGLVAGTSAQILMNTATPTPTWTTLGGDATISATGSLTITKLGGNAVSISTPNVVLQGKNAGAGNSVTSITVSSGTATVTQTAHGFATGDFVVIVGATGAGVGDINQLHSITNTGANTYTFTTTATGTIAGTILQVFWFLGTRSLNATLIKNITRSITGHYLYTFTNTQTDIHYGFTAVGSDSATANLVFASDNANPPTTTTVGMIFGNQSGTNNDALTTLRVSFTGIV